jgi:hypothetical protein
MFDNFDTQIQPEELNDREDVYLQDRQIEEELQHEDYMEL